MSSVSRFIDTPKGKQVMIKKKIISQFKAEALPRPFTEEVDSIVNFYSTQENQRNSTERAMKHRIINSELDHKSARSAASWLVAATKNPRKLL